MGDFPYSIDLKVCRNLFFKFYWKQFAGENLIQKCKSRRDANKSFSSMRLLFQGDSFPRAGGLKFYTREKRVNWSRIPKLCLFHLPYMMFESSKELLVRTFGGYAPPNPSLFAPIWFLLVLYLFQCVRDSLRINTYIGKKIGMYGICSWKTKKCIQKLELCSYGSLSAYILINSETCSFKIETSVYSQTVAALK